jgi:penicillin-binding protein 1A
MSYDSHDDLEQMLRNAVNNGTGRAAMLPIANYGKTGTTQNYRDAVFVGYADDLVVGVWIGNDDNSPLNQISGGGLPARIWKDFMRGALSLSPAPSPTRSPDPEGPIQQLDVEDGEEIVGEFENGELRIRDGELTLETDIEGVPVEFRLTEDGLEIEPLDPDD